MSLKGKAGVVVRIRAGWVDVQDPADARVCAELEVPYFMLSFTSWPVAQFWRALDPVAAAPALEGAR